MLFIEKDYIFPSTRFLGSKLKIVNWIWEAMKDYKFDTVLDAFGGTGTISHVLKKNGKSVTYNDIMKFNWYIGLALIENQNVQLTNDDIEFLVTLHDEIEYPSFVEDTFEDIYYTNNENKWIDMVITNVKYLEDIYKRALAMFALFQACIIKRPFNLFHRKNLYLRFSNVERNFGNKVTWDTPFEVHFRKFINEANEAVFSNGKHNKSINLDVFDIDGEYDLVYIDTPYISEIGVGVDYLNFYHFLEGLCNYSKWTELIDYNTKHKRLKKIDSVWTNKNKICFAFDLLFKKFQKSIIVISYRADGIPSIEKLLNLLKKYKQNVHELKRRDYKYVLSSNNSEEVLLIGT